MPIPLPNLDDHTYDELTAEARALIPILCPAWTNHNPSDPGVSLIELLAWLTEMMLFEVNEIPAANTLKFLQLLNGPAWTPPVEGGLEAATRQTIRDLRERYRAVTPDDFEYLTLRAWPASEAAAQLGSAGRVRRVRCVPKRNLAATDPVVRDAPAPAHVSLVVVPEPAAGESYPEPTEGLTGGLWNFFDPRRTLTTRHHVVGPDYVPVGITANLALTEDAPPQDALSEASSALASFFHPLSGGLERRGWPFGRSVYASEIYALLEQASLVDYVEGVQLTGPGTVEAVNGQVVEVELDLHQLVRLQQVTLVAYDVYGRAYPETTSFP